MRTNMTLKQISCDERFFTGDESKQEEKAASPNIYASDLVDGEFDTRYGVRFVNSLLMKCATALPSIPASHVSGGRDYYITQEAYDSGSDTEEKQDDDDDAKGTRQHSIATNCVRMIIAGQLDEEQISLLLLLLTDNNRDVGRVYDDEAEGMASFVTVWPEDEKQRPSRHSPQEMHLS